GVVFVYSGQGRQRAGMGGELFAAEPVFRKALERCDAAFRAHTDWSLLDELFREETASRLARTDIAQPTIFAIQIALTELWRSWGVEPAAVVGHSAGEVAAAHVAGVLDFDDAVRLIVRRG